jgi:hypothetical protein
MSGYRDATKAQRRKLRELGAVAYERELSQELEQLECEFKRWRFGEINAFELSDAIHRFHQGPSRELFSKYDRQNLDFAVAHAIRRGLLSEDEVGKDTLEVIERYIVFLKAQED